MTLAGPLVQRYFANYLIAQRRLSPQTLASYRDTFRLLLQFVHSELRIEPSRLSLDQLDAEIILRFLDSLEQQRNNAVVSRNLRLTAIRAFFRMVALHHPECVGTATRVLAIPMKRTARRLLEYVSRAEMDAILDGIDRKQWCGRRDYALLLTMYNSGARVSEMRSPHTPGRARHAQPRPTARQGAQGTCHSSLAVDGSHLARVAARKHRQYRLPKHTW
jgi:site-specific recombinase XerD